MLFTKSFLIALFGSVLADLAVLFLLGPLVIDQAMPLHALSVGPVTILTVLGVVAATIVYALMRTVMNNPVKPFIWLSGVVLVLSFIPDYLIIGKTTGAFAGGTPASALMLMLMHVVVATITVYSLVTIWGSKDNGGASLY